MATVTKKATEKVAKAPRVASFTEEDRKGLRVFHPVNKRAHKLAGRKKTLKLEEVKTLAEKFRVCEPGTLKAIKL